MGTAFILRNYEFRSGIIGFGLVNVTGISVFIHFGRSLIIIINAEDTIPFIRKLAEILLPLKKAFRNTKSVEL